MDDIGTPFNIECKNIHACWWIEIAPKMEFIHHRPEEVVYIPPRKYDKRYKRNRRKGTLPRYMKDDT